MRYGICLASLIVLLQGCATQLDIRLAPDPDDPESAPLSQALHFQRFSITPASDQALLTAEDLRPGDIILTSIPTLTSAGIQLMTFAPVSHAAVYIGDHQVAEAVRSGVRIRNLDAVVAEEAVVLALRHPDLNAQQARSIRAYVLQQVGTEFNFFGVALHAPFSLNRKLCELPLMPSHIRDACIRTFGALYHLATSERQFFCSQLVLQAYRHAGIPITDADPRLITPADILHMREGDVPSVRIHRQLVHVGHLKYQPPVSVAYQE